MMRPRSEPHAAIHQAAPGWTPAFGERLQTLFERVGGITKASSISGVTLETLASWRDGKSRPAFLALAGIAGRAGLSLDWLATGHTPAGAGAAPGSAGAPRLFGQVGIDQLAHAFEAACTQAKLPVTGDTRRLLHLTVILYDLQMEQQSGAVTPGIAKVPD